MAWRVSGAAVSVLTKASFALGTEIIDLDAVVYSRCCIRICSAMDGVPHRPLLLSLPTVYLGEAIWRARALWRETIDRSLLLLYYSQA